MQLGVDTTRVSPQLACVAKTHQVVASLPGRRAEMVALSRTLVLVFARPRPRAVGIRAGQRPPDSMRPHLQSHQRIGLYECCVRCCRGPCKPTERPRVLLSARSRVARSRTEQWIRNHYEFRSLGKELGGRAGGRLVRAGALHLRAL